MDDVLTVVESDKWKPQPHAEIFLEDTYRLRALDFAPDLVLDVGANVGCFTGFAKSLWPECRVVAVEPHPDNFTVLRDTVGGLPGVTLVFGALGNGPIRRRLGPNAGGHLYTSESVGFTREGLAAREDFEPHDVWCYMLNDLLAIVGVRGEYIVKIDCEGAEQVLFDHKPSLEALRDAAYWTAELHFFAARHERPATAERLCDRMLETHGGVLAAYWKWLYRFSDSHDVALRLRPSGGMAWARRLSSEATRQRDCGGRTNVFMRHADKEPPNEN